MNSVTLVDSKEMPTTPPASPELAMAGRSCRNRHCPKCQALAKARWLQARKAELLPATYFHNVFTLPHEINPIALCNKRWSLVSCSNQFPKPYCNSAKTPKMVSVENWASSLSFIHGTKHSWIIFISMSLFQEVLFLLTMTDG